MGSPIGMWTSVSGAMAQSQNMDIVANNLANANTVGFKKDSPVFKEYLTALERPPSPAIDIPRTIFKDSDFYHFDGREHAMVNLDRVHTDHSAGNFKLTNQPLDLAVDGPGFFAVQTPSGVLYTRAGDFKINAQGQIVTTDGYPVLALGGEAEAAKNVQAEGPQAPAVIPGAQNNAVQQARTPASLNPFSPQSAQVAKEPLLKPINVSEAVTSGKKVAITPTGEIFSGETRLGFLALAEFSDPKLLQKVGSSFFANSNAANVPRMATLSNVRQGFLETSNVSPVAELLELLKVNRLYESNMRAIKTYNDMSAKEANEVGKL